MNHVMIFIVTMLLSYIRLYLMNETSGEIEKVTRFKDYIKYGIPNVSISKIGWLQNLIRLSDSSINF